MSEHIFYSGITSTTVIQKLAGATVNMPAAALVAANPSKYKLLENATDGTPVFCDMDANVVTNNYAAFNAIVNATVITPEPFIGPRPPHR